MPEEKSPQKTEPLQPTKLAVDRIQRCRAVLPAKTQVPGVGVVGYLDGEWFPSKGYALCNAGGRTVIVHPAQGLITLLGE